MLKRLSDETQADLDLLREARDNIARHGWDQVSYRSPDGVCLLGSVMPLAEGVEAGNVAGIDQASRLFRLLGFASWEDTIFWNDNRERTVEQVNARIDAAITERLLAP